MKNIGILAISALLLTACGGGSSGGDTTENTPSASNNAPTIEKMQGVWTQGCQVSESNSSSSVLTLNDFEITEESKRYSNTNCNEAGLILHEVYEAEVSIGGSVTGANGEEATELDLLLTGYVLKQGTATAVPPTGITLYSAIMMEGDDQFIVAEESEMRYGLSPETRLIDFANSARYTREQ